MSWALVCVVGGGTHGQRTGHALQGLQDAPGRAARHPAGRRSGGPGLDLPPHRRLGVKHLGVSLPLLHNAGGELRPGCLWWHTQAEFGWQRVTTPLGHRHRCAASFHPDAWRRGWMNCWSHWASYFAFFFVTDGSIFSFPTRVLYFVSA